jgi:hypothetical protein
MLLVHYFLPEVGVKMEQVTSQQLLRSLSKTPQVRRIGSVSYLGGAQLLAPDARHCDTLKDLLWCHRSPQRPH